MDMDGLKEPVSGDSVVKNKLNAQAKEVLVQTHTLLIKRIAYHLLGRLPRAIQLDD